jgi:hypothetical protein
MNLAGVFVMSETRHRTGCAKAVKSSAAVIGAIDACPKWVIGYFSLVGAALSAAPSHRTPFCCV